MLVKRKYPLFLRCFWFLILFVCLCWGYTITAAVEAWEVVNGEVCLRDFRREFKRSVD